MARAKPMAKLAVQMVRISSIASMACAWSFGFLASDESLGRGLTDVARSGYSGWNDCSG
jgi:hypothetical protein